MDILKNIDELLVSWGIAPSLADMLDQFIAFALVLIVAFLADVLCRNILLKVVAHLIRKTKATGADSSQPDGGSRYNLYFYSGGFCRNKLFHFGIHPACLPHLYSYHFPEFHKLIHESCL